jgi:hypothetical protein
MLYKDYDRKGSDEKKTGHDPQGVWHQDKLIGSKSPVVK